MGGGLSSFAGELNLAVCPLSGYSPFMICQNSRGVALLHVAIDSHVLSLHQAQRHLGSTRGTWSGYMPCNNQECHQLILLLQAETGKPTCLQGQNSTANSNQASPLERGRESAQASFGSLGNGYRILPPTHTFSEAKCGSWRLFLPPSWDASGQAGQQRSTSVLCEPAEKV